MVLRLLFVLPIFFLLVNIFTPFVFATHCTVVGQIHDSRAANPKTDPCVTGPEEAGVKQLQALILRVINISVAIAFIALTGVLLYAGIRYLTSGGDAKSLGVASSAVTWGLLGVLFLALAWLIILLMQAFTGVKLTDFCIGFPVYQVLDKATGTTFSVGCP